MAHHREITPENFAVTCRRALQLLDHLELDVARAMRRIDAVALELRNNLLDDTS